MATIVFIRLIRNGHDNYLAPQRSFLTVKECSFGRLGHGYIFSYFFIENNLKSW